MQAVYDFVLTFISVIFDIILLFISIQLLFSMTLGERIAVLRKKLKVSQNELGRKVGTSGDIIGRYERDEVKPSIEVASKIADELHVSLDYLMGKTDLELDKSILNRVIEIQRLAEDDRLCLLKNVDAFLRDAKTRQAYAS